MRDKRRIDPITGALRHPAEGQPASSAPSTTAPGDSRTAEPEADASGELGDLQQQLAERTSDVQRVQADYANYRRRVERDRNVARDLATARLLTDLLPVLDDIGRAAEHGELLGGFKSVADALEATLTKAGLVRYGEAGEPFDPTVHEALTHGHSAQVSEPTCVTVLMPGYRMGERILRPARVAVMEPEQPVPAEQS